MQESRTAMTDSVRVRALELLGKTIGLFDDRDTEVAKQELTADELEEQLKIKLEAYLGLNGPT